MTGKLVLLYFLYFHSHYKALLLRRSQQLQVHRNYFQHFLNQLLELREIRVMVWPMGQLSTPDEKDPRSGLRKIGARL